MDLHFFANWMSQIFVAGILLSIFSLFLFPIINRLPLGWKLCSLKFLLVTHLIVFICTTAVQIHTSRKTVNSIYNNQLQSTPPIEQLNNLTTNDLTNNEPRLTALFADYTINEQYTPLIQIPEFLTIPFATFGIVLLSGVFILLGYWLISLFHLRALVKSSQILDKTTTNELLQGAKISPKILLTERKSAAFCGGMLQSFILVSRSLFESLSNKNQQLLIQHELSHLQSKDHKLLHIQFFTIAFHWWIPTVWILGKKLTSACEQHSDAQVLQLGASAKDYASLLLKAASFSQTKPTITTFSISKNYNETKQRIEHILMKNKPQITATLRQKSITFTVSTLITFAFLSFSQFITLAEKTPSTPVTPSPLSVVVIDPGHGGKDSGSIIDGVSEKDLNLMFAKKLKSSLKQKGIKSILTRNSDEFLSLNNRATIGDINKHAFISIHTNFAKNTQLKGIEIFSFKDVEHPASDTLIAHLSENLKQVSAKPKVSTKKARFSVLKNTKCPTALIELGFLSNAEERAQLLDKAHQDELITKLSAGVIAFLKSRP